MTYQRSEHEKKFDRQMRLWGAHGQEALETSHVCVLHSGPTATETLKNLVLPNVGAFTIVDDALVTEADLGCNLFVDEQSAGQSRAECVCRWMAEMNADVKGTALHASVEQLIASDLNFFRRFSLVIACQLSQPSLLALASFLFPLSIPLIALRTYGLIGHARLQVAELRIVESHPSNDRYDLYAHPDQLRLWPELQQYIDSFVLKPKPEGFKEVMEDMTPITVDDPHNMPPGVPDTAPTLPPAATTSATNVSASSSSSPYLNGDGLDSEQHAHIPYIVLLCQLMRRWLSAHGSVPSSYDEKRRFKASISDDSWDYANETNYAEAVEFAHRAYDRHQLDRNTQAVLADQKANTLTPDSEPFWLVVAAVKRFIEREGAGFALPVSQDIPDMHSKTEWYVRLKHIFKVRSERDTAEVIAHVRAIEREIVAASSSSSSGSSSAAPRAAVPKAYIAYVVRHVRALRVVRTRAIADELSATPSSHTAAAIASILEEAEVDAMDAPPPPPDAFVPPNPPLIHWYLALRAVDAWQQRERRWPGLLSDAEVAAAMKRNEAGAEDSMNGDGAGSSDWQADCPSVLATLRQVREALGVPGEAEDDCAVELVRAAACEPHVTAAFMGGVGSQMALKVLLGQYVPLNNTLLYNGYHCASQTWNL